MSLSEPQELWRHSSPQTTMIYDFMTKTSQKHGVSFGSYQDLWRWSVAEPAKFWDDVWHYTAVKAHQPYQTVSSSSLSTDDLRFEFGLMAFGRSWIQISCSFLDHRFFAGAS